jgi:hypothetical protein
MNKDQNLNLKTGESEAGFLKLIVLIVIALIVLNFIGFDINNLWGDYIFPILESGWNILVWIANFLYGFVKIFFNAVILIIDFFREVINI